MARGKIQGWVEQGGHTTLTDGRVSTDKVQQSFPLATVSVFNAGTATPSTIFSDEGGTPKANPFTADSTGFWFFWADQGRYDVQFSGAGITTPFTIFSLETIIAAGLVDPGSNGFLARTAPNVLAARTFLGTTSEILITNGIGGANPVISLDTNLNFSGKTITGGTFVSPIIGNFQNAVHNHENAMGGGQLNASNVFSTGTVPIPRLPAMVGATGVSNGAAGLVPQPLIGDESKFLRGDGTWQTAGGGGGSPGGANTTIQFNNSGVFGGVSGATSDGTNITFGSANLRATRPRFVTSIDDTNGNEIIAISAVGSAVNEFTIANAATGGHPVISSTGGDANINIVLTPKGSGIVSTAGNIQVSNNAPQLTLIDVNDSKTVRMNLSGANWDFTNDTLGTVPIRIDTTNNNVTLSAGTGIVEAVGGGVFRASGGDFTGLQINKTGGTPRFVSVVINGNNLRFLNNAGSDFFFCSFVDEVTTFGQIPVGPASDPTTDNQLPRKKYVDDKSFWDANWFIADPSTFPLASFNLAQKALIPKGNWRALTLHGIFNTGSASGSFSVQLCKHPFADQSTETVLDTITFNSGTLGVGQDVNIADHEFTEKDWLYIKLSARSSPLQRDISISVVGDKLGTI